MNINRFLLKVRANSQEMSPAELKAACDEVLNTTPKNRMIQPFSWLTFCFILKY